MKNNETSRPSYKNDYTYYIKNPNILADRIVEIYKANPNAKALKPNNKQNNVKLQKVVNKINEDKNIGKQYKEFVREFINIPGNTNILYDYETYKNLVLDRINNEEVSTSNDSSSIKEVSTSNDGSFVKEVLNKSIENIIGQGVDEYKMIKIDKDALKKIFLKFDIIMDVN